MITENAEYKGGQVEEDVVLGAENKARGTAQRRTGPGHEDNGDLFVSQVPFVCASGARADNISSSSTED